VSRCSRLPVPGTPRSPSTSPTFTDFELAPSFDAVVCLFSCVGYVKTVERTGADPAHVRTGHYPWRYRPGGWLGPVGPMAIGHLTARAVDQSDLKIARLSRPCWPESIEDPVYRTCLLATLDDALSGQENPLARRPRAGVPAGVCWPPSVSTWRYSSLTESPRRISPPCNTDA
jgi:hypothetical protein